MLKIICCVLLTAVFTLACNNATADPQTRQLNERMAAWHETMVTTDEMRPNSCVSTYVNDKFAYMDTYVLAKLVAGIEKDGKTMWPGSAKKISVEDIPGGVVARYTLDGVKVTTEIVPLMIGRDTKEQDGAAYYSVKTEPSTPVVLRCGDGAFAVFDKKPRSVILRSDNMGSSGCTASVDGNLVKLGSKEHPFTVFIKSSHLPAAEKDKDGGEYASVRFPDGNGMVLISYAMDQQKAKTIAGMNTTTIRKQAADYYNKLLQCRIETPEKVIDQAFRTALYNMEYNWLYPIGWNECIHHWLALWHMQHTAANEWIGLADRSRDCNITTAEHLFPNGAIPQFMPSGMTRRDFGGSNQFWAWQVRHYWKFTGDRESIKKLAPALDSVIKQTYEEYDKDGDGLLSWGQQIGNQEDYVSTPYNGTSTSVEGINMLLTAAEFARALGQDKIAQDYEAAARNAAVRLRSELWQSDLGRFAYYKDPMGFVRPDGQYHTQIYPVIWGILDKEDSYTSMRHLEDRMTGANGETYCSNNFPNHVGGTWGMQAGAAQQPWAAWGLAAVGMRNDTYRPLKACAQWVMNEDHRGSWPEVSTEPCPAYFSPPAGLYVQSTIEALFGLEVNKSAGWLKVSPSFPDSWPSAKLHLPDYSASYSRKGNTLEYTVESRDPLSRKLRWMLPPCKITSVTINGKPTQFMLLPGVNCVVLSLSTDPARNTTFKVSFTPIEYSVEAPLSTAEGDRILINVRGCKIDKLDDRCGILSAASLTGSTLNASVSRDMLKPYKSLRNLGMMNFSRRTFFLSLRTPDGVSFIYPVDITILPGYECAPEDGISTDGKVKLLVRNNTSTKLAGQAYLKMIRSQFGFPVDIDARTEKLYHVSIPSNMLILLSPGDNRASLLLPGSNELDLTISASKLYESNQKLLEQAKTRISHVRLPEDKLVSDTRWREVREFYAYGHMPWMWSKPPMEALEGQSEITVPGLPAITFKTAGRNFIPVSWKMGSPEFRISMDSKPCRKVYLLVIPFLDNHDTFAPVARVTVETKTGGIISRTLSFPGDLDWWCPEEVVGEFSTARKERLNRFTLLPQLSAKASDWDIAKPPAFPQPEFWASCRPLKTKSSVMSVIEIDLEQTRQIKSISLSTIGVDPALGLVAVTTEASGDYDMLTGTQWTPPVEFREPRIVFNFTKENDTLGWKTEGTAFKVAPVPSLFTVPTLNSLAGAGEQATGKAISPDFVIGKDDTWLIFEYQGGNSTADDGPGALHFKLIDSALGETLHKMPVTGSHLLREGRIPVSKWQGKTVRLEMVDENTGNAYAWLGVREVSLSPK